MTNFKAIYTVENAYKNFISTSVVVTFFITILCRSLFSWLMNFLCAIFKVALKKGCCG
jgi:hypothetical protein